MNARIIAALSALLLVSGTAYAADCCKEGANCCKEHKDCCKHEHDAKPGDHAGHGGHAD